MQMIDLLNKQNNQLDRTIMKNKSLKRVLVFFITAVTIVSSVTIADMRYVKAETSWPTGIDVTAEAVEVMDIDTGTVLYQKNPDIQEHPASITKLLTALVAVENCSLDEIVTFSKEAVFKNESSSSSHIARDVGEKMTMEDCLYGMLLASANECADAIAEHVGGTKENFVKMMNDKAKELGCTNSNFACTNGLIDENHYTTAHDMALISRAAYLRPEVAKIAGKGQYTINPTNVHTDPTYLTNHHEMLHGYRTYRYKYEYCKGGKTGYTKAAHFTLVTYAEKDGKRLLCVILNEPTKNMQFTETTNLFEYFFANIEEHKASEIYNISSEKAKKEIGNGRSFKNISMEDAKVVTPLGTDIKDIKYKYRSLKKVDGKTGAIGTVKFSYEGKDIGQSAIYDKSEIIKTSKKTVANKNVKTKKQYYAEYGKITGILIVFAIIILALFAARIFISKKRNKGSKEALWNAWKSNKKRR